MKFRRGHVENALGCLSFVLLLFLVRSLGDIIYDLPLFAVISLVSWYCLLIRWISEGLHGD